MFTNALLEAERQILFRETNSPVVIRKIDEKENAILKLAQEIRHFENPEEHKVDIMKAIAYGEFLLAREWLEDNEL